MVFAPHQAHHEADGLSRCEECEIGDETVQKGDEF